MSADGIVDLRELKRAAADLLRPSHPVRAALQHEPDFLPGPEGRTKLEVYTRLLLAYRGENG